jgi:hypothetical protein
MLYSWAILSLWYFAIISLACDDIAHHNHHQLHHRVLAQRSNYESPVVLPTDSANIISSVPITIGNDGYAISQAEKPRLILC